MLVSIEREMPDTASTQLGPTGPGKPGPVWLSSPTHYLRQIRGGTVTRSLGPGSRVRVAVMLDIEVIDVHDERVFDEWYGAMRVSTTYGRFAPSLFPRNAVAYVHRNPTPERTRLAVVAIDRQGSRGSTAPMIVGTASIEFPIDVDTETAEVDLNVLPAERGHGVGAALWEWTSAHCRSAGRSVFQGEVNVPERVSEQDWPGLRFARARGFVTANIEDRFALDAARAFARLTTRPYAANHSTGPAACYEMLSWVDRCPDDLIDAYARMRTLMATDVPTGMMVRTAARTTVQDVRTAEGRLGESYRSLLTLALTRSGDPAGYTMVFVPIGDEANLLQDDTYVMREHRGHRLGERLKWVNLRQARAISPGAEWIHTYKRLPLSSDVRGDWCRDVRRSEKRAPP